MSIIKNYLLFNHTYLRQLQADSSIDEQAADIAQGVRDWYQFRDSTSTQVLVNSWVEPMLSLLELTLRPLSPAPLAPGSPVPYLLYTAYNADTPVGLCYVTPPGAELDSTTKGSHWMAQAVLAARSWHPASPAEEARPSDVESSQFIIPNSPLTIPVPPLRWVILTNGDQWRLLDAQSLRRYEAYLQVDLGEMARDQSDLTALRVFYRCFHRTALQAIQNEPLNNKAAQSGLDHLLSESNRATERAERHLKQKMEDVLGNLCRGFVAADGQATYSEAERDTIFIDATYLLYRILFIFYAESRGLLPTERETYRQVGMEALAEQAHRYKLEGIPNLNGTTLWDQLKYLCEAIYGAEREPENELGIPAYDGDLFDDAAHPYLARHSITDQYLTDAIFDLGFLPDGQAYRPLDYRDLSVRHLGSLYEGMLEYKLFVAERPMLARRDSKDNVSYLQRDQAGDVKKTDYLIEPGEVYFSQSPGERRATGSYYTPEYIVDYIVKQTVEAGLRERREPLAKNLARWQTELAGALDEAERARLQHFIDQALLDFVEKQVLTFRVADPAMGSGHFLVNATLTIANFIVESLHLDFSYWLSVSHYAPSPGSSGQQASPAASYSYSLSTDPAYWRRRLVERCVYGVDINPLAVELAKLSLWFVTVEWGRPLSFLNHHLRYGNSLVGARLAELAEVLAGARPSKRVQQAEAAGQLSMFEDPAFSRHLTTAAHLLDRIATRVAETVAEVKAQAGDYEQARDELAPYRRLADILTARHFGLTVDEKQLKEMAKYLATPALAQFPAFQRLVEAAQSLAETYDFFHWELEFPELFFDEEGHYLDSKAGFQAVVGNPPYIRQELLSDQKTHFETAFDAVYHGTADLYVYFMAQGINNLAQAGLMGYITANKWLRADYAAKLRVYLSHQAKPIQLLDFGHSNVFPGTDTFPFILLITQPAQAQLDEATMFFADVSDRVRGQASLEDYVPEHGFDVPFANLHKSGWILEPVEVSRLLTKLQVEFPQLGGMENIDAVIWY